MSDIRYINLQTTPDKWKNTYFGDFEAPLALYPLPVDNYYEVQECGGLGAYAYIKTFDTLSLTSSVLINGDCWEVFATATTEPILLVYTTTYVDCPTCQASQPTQTPTPTITQTPSVTPSITPTLTPTNTVTPSPTISTPTPTPTISVTPTITPTNTTTQTPTPSITSSVTPTVTPTFTPTPSATPLPAYYILAENGDALTSESDVNLIVQSGVTEATLTNTTELTPGMRWVVTNNTTSTTFLNWSGIDDPIVTSNIGNPGVNQYTITWNRIVGGIGTYKVEVYEDNGGSNGNLLFTSPISNGTGAGGVLTFTTTTNVRIKLAVFEWTTGDPTAIITGSAPRPFSKFGQTWPALNGAGNVWGDVGGYRYKSYTYYTALLFGSTVRQYFIRTSQTVWTRYDYTLSTKIWTTNGTQTNALAVNDDDCNTLVVPC